MRKGCILLTIVLCSGGYACRTARPRSAVTPAVSPGVAQKLDAPLLKLAQENHSKMVVSAALVNVQITVDKTDNLAEVQKLVDECGGQVSTHLAVALFARIPARQIETIAANPHVWNVVSSSVQTVPQ